MNVQWTEILKSIALTKKEAIDIQAIHNILTIEENYDEEVLDYLYIADILSKEQYIMYHKDYIKRYKEHTECMELRLRDVSEYLKELRR